MSSLYENFLVEDSTFVEGDAVRDREYLHIQVSSAQNQQMPLSSDRIHTGRTIVGKNKLIL